MVAKRSAPRKKVTGRKKATSRKTARRKKAAPRKKSTGQKKTPAKRKYGAKSSRKVQRAMHEMHEGKLTSGRSGKKVTSRKQAIAIGLSEARAEGAKAPPPKKKR